MRHFFTLNNSKTRVIYSKQITGILNTCCCLLYNTVSWNFDNFHFRAKVSHLGPPWSWRTRKDMITGGMVSHLNKNCNSCLSYTKHDERIIIEFPPKILVIIINRFEQARTGNKNKDKIILDKDLLIASSRYILIGSIHHHGNTITSGHYTSNVFYPESAYTCNDSRIVPLNHLEPSDSVYMVIYARSI